MAYPNGGRRAALKKLNDIAPAHDRGKAPLNPFPTPLELRHRGGCHFARSLDELREFCGEHGNAAVTDAIWSSVSTWIAKEWDRAALTNSHNVACIAVALCRQDDRVRLGFPRTCRKPYTSDLPKMSKDSRDEARKVAAESLADWERAGRPYLNPRGIAQRHQFILSCMKYEKENGA